MKIIAYETSGKNYMTNEIALARTVEDMVLEYDEKVAAVKKNIQVAEAALTTLDMQCVVSGTYVGSPFTKPHLSENAILKNLKKSGWRAIYNRLNIESIAPLKDRKYFESTLENPPELTLANAKATFLKYLMHPRYYILKGLAEAFCRLDHAYRSHSKVKIGVKGLPKRIIITSWGSYEWSGYGKETVLDVVNAIRKYRDQPVLGYEYTRQIHTESKRGNVFRDDENGLSYKRYSNGNVHVIFEPTTLLDVNRALSEFYGDVLPDVEDTGTTQKKASTSVSKDLQYYPTPISVIKTILAEVGIYDNNVEYTKRCHKILEPSCGDGRMMDVIQSYGHECFGVECHFERAEIARQKGHSVLTANFLETELPDQYDFVVMNPPFYGNHYEKHVRKAMTYLKTGGILVSILPATENYDKNLLSDLNGYWRDLPVGSFSESGTNVNTGYLTVRKR